MAVCEELAQRWLLGVKEDLEDHGRELHVALYYHEIDLEYVRDDSRDVQKHPMYDIILFYCDSTSADEKISVVVS